MVLTAPAMEEKLGEQFPEAGQKVNVAAEAAMTP
jgi:hypothetical protein